MVKHSLFKAREWFIATHKNSSKRGERPAWINVKLLTELKYNKEIYRTWKRGQAAWKQNQRRCLYVQEWSQESQSSVGVKASRAGDRLL